MLARVLSLGLKRGKGEKRKGKGGVGRRWVVEFGRSFSWIEGGCLRVNGGSITLSHRSIIPSKAREHLLLK